MHFPHYQEPGAGLGCCSLPGDWKNRSFSFFSCSHFPFFYILPTLHFSTSLCHIFFKVHFETIGTSRSPSDSITSTEIKYIVVCVSAQPSHVETQYKMTTKSSLIDWRIVKACLGILARSLPELRGKQFPGSGKTSSVLIWFYFHWHI